MNITNSFPDKSKKEVSKIAFQFYRHFCDIIVEGVKLFSMSRKEVRKRFVVLNPELANHYFDQKRSLVLVGAHYNNWEILASGLNDQIKHQAVGIYAKLENPFFNTKFLKSRTRFGLKMIPTKDVAPYFIKGFKYPTATIFGADQSPTYNKGVHWMTFLNQETAVANGTERFAKKYNHPVVYGSIEKVKRGYYTFKMETLFDQPSEAKDGEISEAFTKKIEEQIVKQPQYWLWTHKRWKRKRQEHE
jgi:KDO2-lipid IV(A) lauroyltransferase